MAFLLDTSILVRLANATDVQHSVAARAVLELHRRGEVLHVTPQVLIEFRNVATRPKSANGAGLSLGDAETHAATFEVAGRDTGHFRRMEGAGGRAERDRQAGP